MTSSAPGTKAVPPHTFAAGPDAVRTAQGPGPGPGGGRGSASANARKVAAAACRWLALLVALPAAGCSVLRAVPAEWPVLAVQLVSFTPWLMVPAAVALILAFLGGQRWLQIVAAALLLCQVFWLFSLDAPRPVAEAAAGANAGADGAGMVELKVMSVNAEFGQADAARIVQLVKDHGIGLLAVQEHSGALEQRLTAAGLDTILPHRISDPTDDGAGSAVYSTYALEQVGLIPDTPFRMPTVRLTLGQGGPVSVLEVTNVHALPPVDDGVEQWRSDLAAVGRLADRPGNRLLLGDFNATYDHSEFRDLLTAGQGLVDVGTASGSRLLPTWPMEGPPLPGIAIDHVVTSPQVGSSGYQVHSVPGTDHAAVLAMLALPLALPAA